MERLPPELLGSFFQALLPIPPRDFSPLPPGADRPKTIQSLRLVSKTWNDAVLETPFVWSYIELSAKEVELLRVHQWLKRSKAAPLHIRIRFHSTDLQEQEVKKAITALWSEAYRWSTYIISASLPVATIQQQGWFKLVPPVPLPNLREAWIMGSEYSSFISELNAPQINILVELGVLTKISLTSLPDLLSWMLEPPCRRVEWERLAQVARAAPKLAVLQLIATPKEDSTGDGDIAEIMRGVTFPSLMGLIISPGRTALGFLERIRAPGLEILVIESYFSDIPIPIPPSSSCPNLKRIRFSKNPRLSAVRGGISRMAAKDLDRLVVEIEIRQFSRSSAGETPEMRKFQEHLKWFEEKCSVNWIYV
ncbi:hypothetical protein FS837_011198 [Tulasnella sp. UAMH 9824]|nr:hypothetical protein FS837_011198 [Tulasnella sp. UAMH 9824]